MAELEKDIEWQCLTWLAREGFWPWKNPTVGVYDAKANSFRRSSNIFSINGAADIIAIRDGVVLFIEVKRVGNKQSRAQKIFESNITKRNGHYLLVYSLQELKEKVIDIFKNR